MLKILSDLLPKYGRIYSFVMNGTTKWILKYLREKKTKEKGGGLDSELGWISSAIGIQVEKLQFIYISSKCSLKYTGIHSKEIQNWTDSN